MRITQVQARRVGNKLGVNFDVISVKTLQQGINIEFEHGKRYRRLNVTNDNITKTAMIALAHIVEFPNYYDELEKLEKKLKREWSGIQKPNIFLY